MLVLYRADEPGIFDPKPEFLVERWISGTDGRFSELEKLNGIIPEGYQQGDYRPHEITGLESGDYWLAEEIAPDYYTRAEPVSDTYELDQEFTLVVLENQEVKGKLKIRKEGDHGELLAGAVFQLQAFQQPGMERMVLVDLFSGKRGAWRSRHAEPIGTEQVQLGSGYKSGSH